MTNIHIILCSHGDFSSALVSSVEMLIGKNNNISAVPLELSVDPASYEDSVRKELEKHQDKHIVCLVDIFGGTPSNTLLRLSREYKFDLIAGFNLPVVISLLTEGSMLEPQNIPNHAVNTIRVSAIDVIAKLEERLKA